MNYAPSGTPAFHADGAPVSQQLNISLREIEYFTSGDIKNAQGEQIGINEAVFESDGATAEQSMNFFRNVESVIRSVPAAATSIVTDISGLFPAPPTDPPA